jgi:tetrahydromethanopterin S-methyltransferase subunit A
MAFAPKVTLKKTTTKIKGKYHELNDWVMDPKGYFLIRANIKTKKLELGHCRRNNEIEVLITGETPQEVYFTACQMGLVSRLDHAAYLGKELQKAFTALELGIDYVQDSLLEIKKKQGKK